MFHDTQRVKLVFMHVGEHHTRGTVRLCIMDRSSPLVIDAEAAQRLAALAPAVACAQANNDKRQGMKVEAGFKASHMGYATAKGTHWMHSMFVGTTKERSMTKEDLLNADLLASTCHAMGRPPIPERKKGEEFFHRPEHADALCWLQRQAAQVVAQKRLLDPQSAREDELSTATFTYLRGGLDVTQLSCELFPGISPGISALTLNVQQVMPVPVKDTHSVYSTCSAPSSLRMSHLFPGDSYCSMNGHEDDNDRNTLEWMGLEHPHLSYLGVFLHGAPTEVLGGEFFAKLPQTENICVAVAPSCALPVFGSLFGLWHTASQAYLTPNSSPKSSRYVRGSVVMNLSRLVARSTACARRCCGLPLASNYAQKHWLLRAGLIPLSSNEYSRGAHAALRERVKGYPINNPETCTPDLMRPFVDRAKRFWYEYEALAVVEQFIDRDDEDEMIS